MGIQPGDEIIKFAKESSDTEFIVCTEEGVDYKLITDNPQKQFYFPNPHPCCADMKLNTPENVLSVLENEDRVVEVSAEICEKALVPLDRMLQLAK